MEVATDCSPGVAPLARGNRMYSCLILSCRGITLSAGGTIDILTTDPRTSVSWFVLSLPVSGVGRDRF